MNYKNELEICKLLSVKAGKAIMKIYGKYFTVEYKDDMTPVTEADKISDYIITNGLKQHFPGYSVLSEETSDDRTRLNNDYCFIVDPLDGTKEFIKKNNEFTVNIALSFKHQPVCGVIYIPASEQMFFASFGNGAFMQSDNNTRKINVSDKTSNITIAVSRSHSSDKLNSLIKRNNIKNMVTAGSSIKGCLIAKGDAEIYYRFGHTMEWDTAAMQCIVEEAGGIFRQMDGTPMYYNRKNSLNEKGFYILNRLENRLRGSCE